MIIAGIGSRKTPENILNEMFKIGQWCKENKILVRSGHADGADFAFEQGAQEYCEAWLPWIGFNKNLKSNAKLMFSSPTEKIEEFAKQFHPNPSALSRGGLAMMCRNVRQILGKNNTDIVVCWTKDGKQSGGTGQALRIAEHIKIPIINMFFKEFSTSDKVIQEILKYAKREIS